MDDLKPPGHLSFDGDVPSNWENWKQLFELYLTAKELEKKEDKQKIAILLTAMGAEAVARFNQFSWDNEEDKKKYQQVLDKFNAEFSGEKRIVFNRFKFWEFQRPEAQPFDEFLSQLKYLAGKCEFLEKDNMVRDKIIFSLKDKQLKERLLREKDPDLKKVSEFCRAAEITKQELKSMTESNRPQAQIDAVYNQKRSKSKLTPQKRYENEQGSAYHSVDQFCTRCGSRMHTNTAQNCPAWNKSCDKCGGRHHFANMCWTRQEKRLQEVQLEVSDDEYFIDAIEESQKSNMWYVHVKVCKSTVKMKIDSGAQACVIPAKTWYKIKDRPNLEKSNTLLRTASGTIIPHKGTTMVKISVGEDNISKGICRNHEVHTPVRIKYQCSPGTPTKR